VQTWEISQQTETGSKRFRKTRGNRSQEFLTTARPQSVEYNCITEQAKQNQWLIILRTAKRRNSSRGNWTWSKQKWKCKPTCHSHRVFPFYNLNVI